MTGDRAPGRSRANRRIATFALCIVVLEGCAGSISTAGTGSSDPGPTASAGSAASSPSASGAAVTQTDTDWGRIWDGVPEAFPVFVGASPGDSADSSPVSAGWVVEGADPREVIAWMQTQLERGNVATEALNGPLEDGSYVLESGGSGSCRIQVVVAPLGTLASIRVRYGAGCPAP